MHVQVLPADSEVARSSIARVNLVQHSKDTNLAFNSNNNNIMLTMYP